jgi:hypothetical protein
MAPSIVLRHLRHVLGAQDATDDFNAAEFESAWLARQQNLFTVPWELEVLDDQVARGFVALLPLLASAQRRLQFRR